MSPLESALFSILKSGGDTFNIVAGEKEVDQRYLENLGRSAAYLAGTPLTLNAVVFNIADNISGDGEAGIRDLLTRKRQK